MVNFKFSNNGRKCIRQILQPYQSGNGSDIFISHFYNVYVNWKFYLKFHLKAKVLATQWGLWKKTSQFPTFLWNKLNFYTILSKEGWSRANLFQDHEIVPISGLKQRKLSNHILVQAEPFGNFALNSTTTLEITKKARDRFVDEKNTQIDYSMFHFWKGSKFELQTNFKKKQI